MTNGLVSERAWTILEKLADGKFHSGEDLAKEFKITRASIFEDINKLGESGIEIQRIRGRGYRLLHTWDQLSKKEITKILGKNHSQFNLEILNQANSSNTVLLQRAALGALSGSVVAVELQTAGKGRLGRRWHSGLGTCLTFSMLWRFDCGLNELSGISLAVGVGILRVMKKLGAQEIKLKWPNDIQTEEGKLGGVLIESQGDMLGPATVVIGIGLNYFLPQKITSKIEQPATSLSEVLHEVPSRNLVLAMLICEMSAILEKYCEKGFTILQKEWEENHAFQNKKIKFQLPDGKIVQGIALGVNEFGALRMQTEQGECIFNSGEVGGLR